MPKLRSLYKRFAIALVTAFSILMGSLAWNTLQFNSRQIASPLAPKLELDKRELLQRLSAAIQIPTVSTQNTIRQDAAELVEFQQFLSNAFPVLFQEPIQMRTGRDFGDNDNHSLLFYWPGTRADLPALLLMAHYDVVPVEPESRESWGQAPFSGHIDTQFVWGRGSLDCKNCVCGLLESIVHLIKSGYEPTRPVYIALGHDEELGGLNGNKQIAQWMRMQGIRLHCILDEGGCILRDYPGVMKPVALVGVGEKGFASIELSVKLPDGGHSSMPPQDTAINLLATALNRLHAHPFPTRLDGGADVMLDFIGPEMDSNLSRVAIANRWLFGPLVKKLLGATPSGNATLRTTLVPTVIRSGNKDNVLPTSAQATVNIRVLPGDSVDSIVERIGAIISDSRVSMQLLPNSRAASTLSDPRSSSFELLQQVIGSIYSHTLVAPFVLVGGTDSSHYADLCPDIFRFAPVRLQQSELSMFHGINERISQNDYLDQVRFYRELIQRFTENQTSQ